MFRQKGFSADIVTNVMFAMTWPSILRRAVRGRQSEPPNGSISSRTSPRREQPRSSVIDQQPVRHPAMARIDVSPVHGRHCDCERCRRTDRAESSPGSERPEGERARRPAA
jgi:hypothetical protein